MPPTPTADQIADVRLVGGEIRARGPQMLIGYLHPEDDAEAFDAGGYFRTGDLGSWVDDDYLVVTGRAKDVIIRNGENISPGEIEDLLVTEPGIAEIAVVGVPDARTGERACAVIVPGAGPAPGVDDLGRVLAGHGRGEVQGPRAGGDLGRPAQERRRQGAQAPDPGNPDGGAEMRVAIVTGASSGIGLGTAVKLAEQGMAVLGTGRDEARLAELASAVGDPERIATVAVDLTATTDRPPWWRPRCPGGAASTS